MQQATREAVREGCKRSASVVLPEVFDTIGTPASLIDVGAGEGWWCHEALNLGVQNAHAVDVDHPTPTTGHWDAEARDLLPLYIARNTETRWSVALCLEVAEHLSPAAGDWLVAELCRVADEVVWSAAIPGQGGDGHQNEQWPEYWHRRFQEHGYSLEDPWRPELWDDQRVEPWYRQNILHAFRIEQWGARSAAPLAMVHPVTWAHHRGVPAPRSY